MIYVIALLENKRDELKRSIPMIRRVAKTEHINEMVSEAKAKIKELESAIKKLKE